jgi:hypothetical protein
MEKTNLSSLPEEVVMNKIYMIRGQKVMLDADLAELTAFLNIICLN